MLFTRPQYAITLFVPDGSEESLRIYEQLAKLAVATLPETHKLKLVHTDSMPPNAKAVLPLSHQNVSALPEPLKSFLFAVESNPHLRVLVEQIK